MLKPTFQIYEVIMFYKKRRNLFRFSSSEDNQVELFLKGRYSKVKGFWPLVDENYEETPFVAVGRKSSQKRMHYY